MDTKIVWTYLNITDPLVAWETYRGILISPDCYSIENNPANKGSIRYSDLKLIDRYEKFTILDTRKRNFEFSLPGEINVDFNIHKLAHS